MLTYNLERARAAVQFLVSSSYAAHHIKRLRTYVQKPRALPFKDDAECLNELLVIGRQNKQALENLIELAEFKRDSRTDYQRQFMAAKRARDRRVVEFETIVAGRPLTLDERNAVLHKQYAVWNKEKAEYMAQHDLSDWKTRNETIRKFWQIKERELEDMVAEATASMKRSVHRKERKRIVQVKREPDTVLGKKLRAAMTRRKTS